MTDTYDYRPRRSCLYMPGSNARALEKARTLPADMLILDMEDAVSPDAKARARKAIAAAVAERAYGSREVLVRINELATEWGLADLEMAVSAGADGLLAPKVGHAEDILSLDRALSAAGASPGFGLWVMIEVPLAILNIQAIAATSGQTRLAGFVLGTNDLAKETNAVYTPDRRAFQVALSLTLTAARAYGLVALDSVFSDIKDTAGLAAECEQARVLGFDGKTLIHPGQVDTANRAFSPDKDDVRQAETIVAAFALHENRGKGVINLDGKMVEILHLRQAERLVAIARAIAGA